MNYVDMASKLGEYAKNDIAVENSIQNILSTSIGSVPGHPEFGCGIDKYLFELIDPLISQMIEEEIRYAIDRWEPRVEILKVIVIEDTDYNRIVIKISYIIKRDVENIEREFIYKIQQ
ncbi:MAG: GPW/gp25 family protein [Candidatus Aerophobetes bacterium]|nr:GPW/gp25 family protein [Candidatus Aerophobetes bacterium]